VQESDPETIAGKITCYRTPSGRVLFRRNDVRIAVEHKPGRSADKGAPDPAAGEGRAYGAEEERPGHIPTGPDISRQAHFFLLPPESVSGMQAPARPVTRA
jgi:hypothetical protein